MRGRAIALDEVVPAITVGPLAEAHWPVLLWVHTGSATVEAAGVTYALSQGEAIWVPPGVTHSTQTCPGAVVYPFLPRVTELSGLLAQVTVVAVPSGWEDWMIHQADQGPHTREPALSTQTLLKLVKDRRSPQQADSAAEALPMPRSREARGVAEALLRNPGSPLPIDRFAERERISVKTLQRQFLSETSVPFSEWRARARILAAAQHLTQGRDIGWTRRNVGYETAAGFTKAFKNLLGLTPQQFIRRTAVRGHLTPSAKHDEVAKQTRTLIADGTTLPPPLRTQTIWERINDFHVLMWAYSGTSLFRIGRREQLLRQGEAIWLPAGAAIFLQTREGSTVLPLGENHSRATVNPEDLTVYTFPPEAEPFLLHTMLAEYTLFRPEGYRNTLTEELFRDQFITGRDGQGTSGLTGAVGEIARFLHRNPADSRSLADWASRLHISPQKLGNEFLTQTGVDFRRWRSQLRMNLARDFLWIGDPPGEVAKRLGYATPSTFADAFTAAHGMPPREYQRREVS